MPIAGMSKRHAVRRSQRSVVARIEELVLAGSGADAFELVFSMVAARLAQGQRAGRARASIARSVKDAARRWPGLDVSLSLDAPDRVLEAVSDLLDRAALAGDAEGLDAVFEQLVTRVGKGDKGQFFTPRHVVDWTVKALLLERGERVVDPACGSGAFLVHARAAAKVETWGFDLDPRAVRVARLIAVATGGDPERIARADSLERAGGVTLPDAVDVVITNPPFAGDVDYAGYAVARLGRRAERDALFVERCVEVLRPGGRLAIVLPHNKVAARAWSGLRRWLLAEARVLGVVSLPRETFLPHTSQKVVVLFAQRRARPMARPPFARESVFFTVSQRAGKDAAGEPILRPGAAEEAGWRAIDHDLGEIAGPLGAALLAEGFGSASKRAPSPASDQAFVVRTIAELGSDLTLAPERHCANALGDTEGIALSTFAVERGERVAEGALGGAVVFDTTHALDGILDVHVALRARHPPSSAKKLVRPGDLLVSRLRPYLRQIAFVHPALAAECGGRPMACSTEFYVLAPRDGESLAFLLPWLLGDDAQALLAAAQEGGHHPRVPRETLLAMRVPTARLRARKVGSARVERAIADFLKARAGLARLIRGVTH